MSGGNIRMKGWRQILKCNSNSFLLRVSVLTRIAEVIQPLIDAVYELENHSLCFYEGVLSKDEIILCAEEFPLIAHEIFLSANEGCDHFLILSHPLF